MRFKEILEAVPQGTIPPQAQRKVPQGTGAMPDEFGARTMGKGTEIGVSGAQTTYNKDGSSVSTNAMGQATRDKFGRITQTKSPRIAGVQQTDNYNPGSIGNAPTSQSTNFNFKQGKTEIDATMPGPANQAKLDKATDIKVKYGNASAQATRGPDGKLNYTTSMDVGPNRLTQKSNGNIDVLNKKTGQTYKTSTAAMATGKDGI